jgi:hypothetical protein
MIKNLLLCAFASITLGHFAVAQQLNTPPPADTPSSEAEVKKALNDLRPQSPGLVAPGEYTFIETTQAVESSPAKVLGDDYFWVRSKFETQDNYTFRVHHQNMEFRNGVPYRRDEESDVVIDKNHPAPITITSFSNLNHAFNGGNFFNLKKSQGLIDTPQEVLKRKECGGLKDCPKQLKAAIVEFDYDELNGYNRWVRLHYTYWGSAEVPYMSSPLKACFTGPFDYQGYTLTATRCSTVLDFSTGK